MSDRVELFCGVCYFESGPMRRLTAFRRWIESEKRFIVGGYACGFCQAERHPQDTKLRAREVLAVPGKETDTETSVRIPHVVLASGKAF